MNDLGRHLIEAAARRGEAPEAALRHHLLEGLLRRLALLPAAGDFVLRGGLLTRALVAPVPRPTLDLDLVGDFPFALPDVVRRFAPVVRQVADDGVVIDPDSLHWRSIWEDTAFPGVRFDLRLGFGAANQTLTVDVGFNDPLVPEAVWLDYPALLGDWPRVRVCRTETLVGWKLHGLAESGAGWRPKDLADLWRIVRRVPLCPADLIPAAVAAFESRGMSPGEAARLLRAPRWDTKTARVRWETGRGELPELGQVVGQVRAALLPILEGGSS